MLGGAPRVARIRIEPRAAQRLAGQGIDQVALDADARTLGGAGPPHQHVIDAIRVPVSRDHISRAAGLEPERAAIQGLEAAAPVQVVLHYRRKIEAAAARGSKGHDGNRDRIGHALGDIDLQLGARTARRAQHRRPQADRPHRIGEK